MKQRDLIKQSKLHGLCLRPFRATLRLLALTGFCSVLSLPTVAQVPALLNYQGRIEAGATVFDGTGHFKLALVNSDASEVYWRNDADADNDGEPDQSVSVPVSNGLYSLMLGDTSLANMAELSVGAFSNPELFLRVWFNDGVNGFQLLSPDQRIASVGYAMVSGSVPDGTITSSKLAGDVALTITSLTDQLAALSDRLRQVEASTVDGLTVVSRDPQDADLIAKGFQSFSSVAALSWSAGSDTGIPAARVGHTAIWSGQEAIIWGGYLGAGIYANSGGRYGPEQDAWSTITTFAAPSSRQSHSAIWTGTEMIVWGGFGSGGEVNTGGRYEPAIQRWTTTATSGAPAARSGHTCVWTGSEMIVWGGRSTAGYFADGGLYDPASNQWAPLAVDGAPEARHSAAAVWSGDRMIVWGGQASNGPVHSGGRLLIDASGATQWETISSVGAPSARTGHSAVWTGGKMIVWGGQNGNSFFSDGALYDPAADSWTALPSSGAPLARTAHVAVWTGTELIVYGGKDGSGPLSSGGAYDPASNTWRALNTAGDPLARTQARAIWSGTELIVFGGEASGQLISVLQRLNPQPAWHFYRKL